MESDLLIIGAGPVGTCLAIDAAQRGLNVTLVEARRADEPPDAKCNTIASRTMETFRRFGISKTVRDAGLLDDYPTDTVYAVTLRGPELTRIRMPSRIERGAQGFHDSAWLTPEGMVRQSQLFLEPILRERLLKEVSVHFLPQHSLAAFTQDDTGVHAICTHDGREIRISARYLIGCDGGASSVRKTLGIKLLGDAELGRTRTTLVRSKDIKPLFGERRLAWMNWISNPNVSGNVIAINGDDLWLLHRTVPPSIDFEALDLDQSIRDLLGVDCEFQYESLHHQDWTGRRLVAERFREGRAFLAGDAAHLWVPYAGYGMNAGIADATNLSWLLSAVIQGWGHESILDAYEAERLPITDQVSRLAMGKMAENAAAIAKRTMPSHLGEDSERGRTARTQLGEQLFALNVPQMAPEGLNYGYYYDQSPIIHYDGESAPQYDMGTYTPSTVPGCRLPHFWIGGESILDQLGDDYTLLSFGLADATMLHETFTNKGIPLTVLQLDAELPAHIDQPLLIVRSDQTIVWRGTSLPKDRDAFADKLAGRPS